MARRNQFHGHLQPPLVPHFFVHAPYNALVIGGHSVLLLRFFWSPRRRHRASLRVGLMWGRSEACPSLLPTIMFCNPAHRHPTAGAIGGTVGDILAGRELA